MALLAELEEPIDLVLCDPPWALRRGRGHFADGNGYRRDHTRVVPGYVDIDVERYLEFTHGWVTQAAAALRPAGQLAVITGPQRAAIVQHAAENARLTWVSSIVARREFPLATLRRPASAHWTITVMCRGALGNPGACSTRPGTCRPRAAGTPTRSTGRRKATAGPTGPACSDTTTACPSPSCYDSSKRSATLASTSSTHS